MLSSALCQLVLCRTRSRVSTNYVPEKMLLVLCHVSSVMRTLISDSVTPADREAVTSYDIIIPTAKGIWVIINIM